MMRTSWLAILLVPGLAWAQPKTADEYYKEGENQYNLGNFPAAVDAFKKGYEAETDGGKKAAYLYNVAQSYRQAKDCSNAVFFYKRYLALKENDARKPLKPEKRQEIEGWITELDSCAKQQESIRNRPPDTALKPDGEDGAPPGDGGKQVAVTGDPSDGVVDDGVEPPDPDAPQLLSARLVGGAAKLNAGSLDIDGVLVTGALLAGYPLPINRQLTLEVGAGFTYTAVPYTSMAGTDHTATMGAVFANFAATYEVIDNLGIRGDVGAGALFLAGVSMSPFTDNAPTSGALGMFHLRVGVSVDYAFTKNLLATITPIAFSYSPPKSGLRDDITSITAIDVMIGVGYRM